MLGFKSYISTLSEMFVRSELQGVEQWVLAYKENIWILANNWRDPLSGKVELIKEISDATGLTENEILNLKQLAEDRTRPDLFIAYMENRTLFYRTHVMALAPNAPLFKKTIDTLKKKKIIDNVKVFASGLKRSDAVDIENTSIGSEFADIKDAFHGTTILKLQSIAKKGLTSTKEKTFKDLDISGEVVFLTVDSGYAMQHGMGQTGSIYDPADIPAVIMVKVPDPAKIIPDLDVVSNVFGKGSPLIPAEYRNIKFPKERNFSREKRPAKLAQRSIAFGYKGRILPSNIIKIYSLKCFGTNPDGSFNVKDIPRITKTYKYLLAKGYKTNQITGASEDLKWKDYTNKQLADIVSNYTIPT